jgi:hypothetical protein
MRVGSARNDANLAAVFSAKRDIEGKGVSSSLKPWQRASISSTANPAA